MAILRMDHVGVVVDDLAGAIEFFAALGLEPAGEGELEDPRVDRIIALQGVRTQVAFLRTPDGHNQLELIRFHAPPSPPGDPRAPSHAPGLRHLCFAVDDLDAVLAVLRERGTELMGEVVTFEPYRLCYARGPEGIIVELAERVDGA